MHEAADEPNNAVNRRYLAVYSLCFYYSIKTYSSFPLDSEILQIIIRNVPVGDLGPDTLRFVMNITTYGCK
jgi:hypothetical protein